MAKFAPVPIRNFSKASGTLFRGAAPTESGIRFIRSLGIKTIIDLRAPGIITRRECVYATNYDLNYFNIPVNYLRLSDTIIAAFLAVALHPRYQPAFVHCIGGEDRTGAMVAIYRVAMDGWPFNWAYREMLDQRFHPWQLFLLRDVKKFAQRMKELDQQQRMSALQELVRENLFTT